MGNYEWNAGPGRWFPARYSGDCSRCGGSFDEGDPIRADGDGGWECCEEELPRLMSDDGPKERICGSCWTVLPKSGVCGNCG